MKSHEVLKRVVESVGTKQVAHDLGVSSSLVYKWCSEPAKELGEDGSGVRNPLDRLVHLDRQARPLLEAMPHLDATYSGAYLERLVRVGRSTCHSPWNWKVTVENFIESYHHAAVHPKTLQPIFPYQKIYEVDNFGEAWSAIEHPPESEDAEPLAVLTVYPTLLIAINRSFGMFWFQLNILGHDSLELDMQTFVTPEHADNEGFAKLLSENVVSVNDEDVAINQRIWRGMHSRGAAMGPLSRYEEGVKRFRRWMLTALADGASSAEDAVVT